MVVVDLIITDDIQIWNTDLIKQLFIDLIAEFIFPKPASQMTPSGCLINLETSLLSHSII